MATELEKLIWATCPAHVFLSTEMDIEREFRGHPELTEEFTRRLRLAEAKSEGKHDGSE